MFSAIAFKLDRLGMRPLVARLASIAYKGQSFSVDRAGRWVNRQKDCTIVSPTIHTASHAAFRDVILGLWAYRYSPKPGDVIVDLGAGVGEEAVAFSRMIGPPGKLFAVEAAPATFACLEQTVRLSRLTNVVPVQCAVADRDGEALISDGDHMTNSIIAGGTVKVPQRSLDSLVAEWGVARIDLLRLNIEGAEKLAVRGMEHSIGKVRNVAISCHDFCGLPSKEEVMAFLKDSGFKVTTRQSEPDAPWIGDYLYGSRTAA